MHGLSGDVREANTYYEDPHKAPGRFDFVMANPPFNVSGVDKDRLRDDPRFALTADQLKAKGITDFQLHYAMETLNRLGTKTMKLAEKPVKGKAQN